MLNTPIYESTAEREMDSLREILNSRESNPEVKASMMQEFARTRAKTEETIQWLLGAHSVLKRVST